MVYPLERMSWGQFKLGNQSKRVLEKCKKKRSTDKVLIFDVDENKVNYVDTDALTSHFHGSRSVRPNEPSTSESIIKIDDDDEDSSFACDPYKNAGTNANCSYSFQDDECVMFVDKGKTPCKASKKKRLSSECGFSKHSFGFSDAFGYNNQERNYFKVNTSENHGVTGSSETHEASENINDCEILDDSSGRIREEWEKAASKKRSQVSSRISHEYAKTSGSNAGFECHFSHGNGSFCNTSQKKNGNHGKNGSSFFHTKQTEDDLFHPSKMTWKRNNFATRCSENGIKFKTSQLDIKIPSSYKSADIFGLDAPVKQSMSTTNVHVDEQLKNINEEKQIFKDVCMSSPQSDAAEVHCDPCLNNMPSEFMANTQGPLAPTDGIAISHQENNPPSVCTLNGKQLVSPQSMNEELTEECLLNIRTANSLPEARCCFIGDREKLKQTDEYRLADEEEWACRQEQLRIQSDEVQKLRKRKKAQALLLSNMEKRQKERLEEVRESHKKEMETINLKDIFRAEVRRELGKIELMHRDMTSLLRSLGIHVDGGALPSALEVNAAYKKALLRFHPDRSSGADLRQQVDAEEKFKLISRLKEKLLPR